jgi:L-ascorbate metabolism protein UlaG (beta-lactamase superfamily)
MVNTNSIRLQYLGCSAFVISDDKGTAIALDLWTKGAFPYAEDTPEDLELGEPPELSALLVSHDHKDHSYIPPGLPVTYGVQSRKVEDNPAFSRVGKIAIGKFSSQHFASEAKRPKLNAVFVLTVAGIKLVHLGDAHGTMADESQLRELKQKIGDVEILLIPVGSPWLKPVDCRDLDMTISILCPRVSLPMHYWKLDDKAGVLSSLSALGYQIRDMQGNSVDFTSGKLPARDLKTIWNVPAGKFHRMDNN